MMRKLISGILLVCITISIMTILPGQALAATPTTTLTISEPEYGSSPTYVNSITTFSLSASESGSSWYRWNTYDAVEYANPFGTTVEIQSPGAPILPIDLEGLNTLYYNSSDGAGNHESPKTLEVFVDNYGPSTTIEFADSVVHSGTTYLNITSEISLSSTDSGSGLKQIFYRIDQGYVTTYTAPFTIYTAGSHTIYYYAEDNLGNQETDKSATVFVDTVGPEVLIVPGEPSTSKYISSATHITIEATDEASGVAEIYYRIDQDLWQAYTTPLRLTDERSYSISAYAVDRIGHPCEVIHLERTVDNTPPEVSVTGAVDDAISVDRGDTLFFVTSDSGVSDCTIFYSLDGGLIWTEYAGITVEENMVITYYAQDALGNSGIENTLTVTSTANPSSNNMFYLGIGFSIAAIGIVILIYINRPEPDSPKKDSKEVPEPNKKKSNKRNKGA